MSEETAYDWAANRTAIEARAWLGEHPDLFLADCFGHEGSALQFVDTLYSAGALLVTVLVEVGRDAPDLLHVALPDEHIARAQLFALFAAEAQQCDQDFAAYPDGLVRTRISREMAEELGDLDAEGQWLEEAGPPRDAGQQAITLWWD